MVLLPLDGAGLAHGARNHRLGGGGGGGGGGDGVIWGNWTYYLDYDDAAGAPYYEVKLLCNEEDLAGAPLAIRRAGS